MTAQAVQQISSTGLAATYTAVAASDTITILDGSAILILHVKNAGGSVDTVTITDPGTTPAGSAATNPTRTVTNATEKFIPLDPRYANSSGVITVAHSFTTSVTCAVLRND